MAAIALTAPTSRNISPVRVHQCRINPYIASVAITAGLPVYLVTATGKVAPTSSAANNALAVFLGIALNSVGPGKAVEVLEEGYADGFEVQALAFGAAVYLNDAAGVLGTTAGTVSVVVGRVVPVSDKDPATALPSKLVYFKSNLI